jgi:hypothetical protein
LIFHDNFSPDQKSVLEKVYLDFQVQDAEAKARLADIAKTFGPSIYEVLVAAYVGKTITTLEVRLNLPNRAGKSVLSLVASTLMHHQKGKSHVYC